MHVECWARDLQDFKRNVATGGRKTHKLVSIHEFDHHLTFYKRIDSFAIFDCEIMMDKKIAKLKSYSI